jgi:ribosomal protein S18 acetylase RimI-like enzyme
MHPLDDPVGASLRRHHAHLARRWGSALTYRDGPTFAAVPVPPTTEHWQDLAQLLGPGALADLFGAEVVAPRDWQPVFEVQGYQLTGPATAPECTHGDADVVPLESTDVPDMLALAAVTRPGPLWPASLKLGNYVGVRSQGVLVAMAGLRLHPPGWRELSSICVQPSARGDGLGRLLVDHLVNQIHVDGERCFLHVAQDNQPALRLYQQAGFEVRRPVRFHGYRVPDDT